MFDPFDETVCFRCDPYLAHFSVIFGDVYWISRQFDRYSVCAEHLIRKHTLDAGSLAATSLG